jgi:hypothetical protein
MRQKRRSNRSLLLHPTSEIQLIEELSRKTALVAPWYGSVASRLDVRIIKPQADCASARDIHRRARGGSEIKCYFIFDVYELPG